ncbi:UNVERIFIED_CONTAM: hypothetical protein Sangu_2914400 [Sesamum angustifolium]|uniref:Reverse transcriptase n=1 Tax=Sesamum angustifolium TaxID=2727405 RepID=A0AAW2IMN3_9LAMI
MDNNVFEWGPKLPTELTLELCRAVTPLEVKQAIFQISDNKAPGIDGYSTGFFKRAWKVVGDQVCTAVMDFFRSRHLLRKLNQSIIAIVPKSEHCPTSRLPAHLLLQRNLQSHHENYYGSACPCPGAPYRLMPSSLCWGTEHYRQHFPSTGNGPTIHKKTDLTSLYY